MWARNEREPMQLRVRATGRQYDTRRGACDRQAASPSVLGAGERRHASWLLAAVASIRIPQSITITGKRAFEVFSMRMIKTLAVAAGVALAGVVTVAQVQRPGAAAASGTPDLSGFWGLSFDGRKIPPAKLAPSVTRAMLDLHTRRDAHAIRWCNLLGTPFVMDSGTPLDVRQGTTTVIIAPENGAAPRYLYLNRRQHISKDIYDPSTNGDSIGHWEGNTLVVDTIGFHPKRGVTSIPGGGFKTENSHLVERYQLVGNGSVLSVKFTWTDPNVFREPHSYEFRYYRMPNHYEPVLAFPCNPYDDVRAQFLGDPAPFQPESAR
ncbi:MAG: hypothetical protein C5B57_02410 [Blastocatellia bacterium]|nr:MAG: hypothetical protein C5B57_02410 [Blastocatellia bacterium]